MPPPLITAIKEKKLEEVELLVNNGADLEVVDQKYQESVLFIAIQCMNKEILDVILSKKHENGNRIVDVNKKNSRTGHTPLHWAIVNRNFHAVEKLLTLPDIKLNEKNKRGNTPLHMAVDKNFVRVVWALAVQPKINFDALNLNKCKPEDVNLGGPESQKARNLLKKCREQIEKYPDRRFLSINDTEEIRSIMFQRENIDLPEVRQDFQNNMYVNISNVTAQNVNIAGETINHCHGAVEITPNPYSNIGATSYQPSHPHHQYHHGSHSNHVFNQNPSHSGYSMGQSHLLDQRPNTLDQPNYGQLQQQNIPSHVNNQPHTRDELPPSYDQVTSSFNQHETYHANHRPQYNSGDDRFHEVMVDLKIN